MRFRPVSDFSFRLAPATAGLASAVLLGIAPAARAELTTGTAPASPPVAVTTGSAVTITPAHQVALTSGVPSVKATTVPQELKTEAATTTDTKATTETARRERTVSPEDEARQVRLLAAVLADEFREGPTTPTVFTDLEVTLSSVRFPEGRKPANLSGKRFVATTETLTGPMGQQPKGALSGKIVFCSAGHGWTNDNTSTSLWYTQRPALLGMVEDFGNLDQMNLYADLAFRAGATVVPMRPVGHQRVERVIDNDSPHHTKFQGPWSDSQSTIAFRLWNEEVPYRFAAASLEESAVARFRPVMPRSDYYPVYVWARTGGDRVNQTYRVVHTGGATEVKVDHSKVGNGWVYLGEYYFEKGDAGYVEVTNRVTDPAEADGKHVVIADAIRFGNGMGDINRGGGISGRPREEEASRYWAENQLARGVEPLYDAFEGSDQSTNVGTPPRMAAHMNRETAGNFFDRVFLSFHSNAVGGRGVCGLFCVEPARRPDYQAEWAEMVAREVNAEMLSGRTKLPAPWSVFPKPAFGHINFGEIRRDYINNEMTATILEVAFHDNPIDAMLLRMPAVRQSISRASLQATLKYFNRYAPDKPAIILPPYSPTILRVETEGTSAVLVNWAAPNADQTSAPVEAYRVYHSEDGFGFDGGVEVRGETSRRFDGLTTGTPHFFQITAVNRGGESLPSRTLGTNAITTAPRVLLLSGFSTLSEDLVLTQTAEANMGRAGGPGGEFVRNIPRLVFPRTQAAVAGAAAAEAERGFDSATAEALTSGGVDLKKYAAVVALFGRETAAAHPLAADLQTSLSGYLKTGGALFLSGSSVIESLDSAEAGPTDADRKFALDLLGVRHGGKSTETLSAAGDPDGTLSTAALTLVDPTEPDFLPRSQDVITAGAGARSLLLYDNPARNGAAVWKERSPEQGPVVVFGFPFEEIVGKGSRLGAMAQVLDLLGIEKEVRPPDPVLEAGDGQDGEPVGESRRRSGRRRNR